LAKGATRNAAGCRLDWCQSAPYLGSAGAAKAYLPATLMAVV